MRDKITRTLFGVALGGTIGIPVGLWGRKKAEAFFGRTKGFLNGPAEDDMTFNYKEEQFTNDAGQALVLLGSIASTDYGPNTRDIALRMLTWAERGNTFENNVLESTLKATLANFGDNIQDPRITDKMLSNGSAMRTAPVSCLFKPGQKGETARYIYQASRATHTSDVAIIGVAMIAEAVSSAMVRDDSDEVIKNVFGAERLGYGMGCETFSPKPGERLKIGLDIAKAHRGDDGGFIRRLYDVVGAGVGTTESVPTALSVAYFVQDPNRSYLLYANMAGDIDTIGAATIIVYGVFTGLGQVKQQYTGTLEQQNDTDFDHYIQILEKGRGKLA